MRHLKKTLGERLAARGLPLEQAGELASFTIAFLLALGAIPKRRLERLERDEQIYNMRGSSVACADIMSSYGISRSEIYASIRRHRAGRQAGLRACG